MMSAAGFGSGLTEGETSRFDGVYKTRTPTLPPS
jgi:hypothetical protein